MYYNNYQKWSEIKISALSESVFKKQVEIYTASKNNDLAKLRIFQNDLINSAEAKILAVHFNNYPYQYFR